MGSDTEPMAEIIELEFWLSDEQGKEDYTYVFDVTLSSSDED